MSETCAIAWVNDDGVSTCQRVPTFDVRVQLDDEYASCAEVCEPHLGVTIRNMLVKHGATCCHVEPLRAALDGAE